MQQDDRDIRELAERGRLIEAIRLFRERYPVGLKEAKDAVEAMQRGDAGVPPGRRLPSSAVPAAADPQLQEFAFDLGAGGAVPNAGFEAARDQIASLVRSGKKIDAIKLYRALTGVDLAEAKQAIDRWPYVPPRPAYDPRATAPSDSPAQAPERPAYEPRATALSESAGPGGAGARPAYEPRATALSGTSGAAPCTGHIDDRNLGQGIDLALQTGRKTEAIQLYQDRYGVTRQEAEAAIAARMAGSGAGIETKSGCTSSVLAAIALLCAAASFCGAFLLRW